MFNAMSKIDDVGRILQKFMLGRGDPNDLLAVSATIKSWHTLCYRIREEREMEQLEEGDRFNKSEWASLDALMHRMTDFQHLSERIDASLYNGETTLQGKNEDVAPVGEESQADEINIAPINTVPWKAGYKWVIRPQ